MSVQKIDVTAKELGNEVGYMTPEELDALPFGVIRLDERGVVNTDNRYEESFANRSQSEVIGKDFFTDVAPCTSVRQFKGAFENAVNRGRLHFSLPQGEKVRIRMISTEHGGRGVWIFVTPLEN